MIGWLRGVWLRAGAMNVLLKEYNVPMEMLDGPLKPAVVTGIKLSRQHGGNAYDAASTIMAIATRATKGKGLGDDKGDDAIVRAPVVAVRLMPLMKLPETLEAQWAVALDGDKRA